MRKRLLVLLFSFVVIYLFNFSIPRLMPGDPFQYSSSVSGEDMTEEFSKEQKEQMKKYYGLDKPIGEQLVDTITKNIKGDFGISIHYKRQVSEILKERFPWTLYIMGATLVISLLLGSILALICVRNRKFDKVAYGILSAASEIPPFLIGIVLLFLIAAKVSWIPLSGAVTPFGKYATEFEWIYDVFIHSLLPILAMCIVTIPKFYFTARASFLRVLEKPYLVNAKAKGLKEKRILWKYIFINGITPIIARFFLSVGTTVGGTLLIENVFAYPGLGTVMREAVRYRDYTMIQGVFLLSTIIVLVSLLISDIINDFVDKRGIKV